MDGVFVTRDHPHPVAMQVQPAGEVETKTEKGRQAVMEGAQEPVQGIGKLEIEAAGGGGAPFHMAEILDKDERGIAGTNLGLDAGGHPDGLLHVILRDVAPGNHPEDKLADQGDGGPIGLGGIGELPFFPGIDGETGERASGGEAFWISGNDETACTAHGRPRPASSSSVETCPLSQSCSVGTRPASPILARIRWQWFATVRGEHSKRRAIACGLFPRISR